MNRHWIKEKGHNQYNGNRSWKLSGLNVPAKHKLVAGDQYFSFWNVYTLVEIKVNPANGNVHYYWNETEREGEPIYSEFRKGR